VARLYASAHGIYQVEINGRAIGNELLAPGWQSYQDRLHYQTYDVTPYLVNGDNVIGAYVAEGWFAGRLGRPGVSNVWGERLGFLGQLEVDGKVICASDSSWQYLADGPVVAAEIYNGEIFDTTLDDPSWSIVNAQLPGTGGLLAEELIFPSATLISPDVAPVRTIAEIQPQQLITSPSGKLILDFGQNLVGRLKFLVDVPGKSGDQVVIRHAEVLENKELGTRPLRTARAENIIKLGGRTKGYESRFSWYGFR
jgi:alpha-L-rhamnosidase